MIIHRFPLVSILIPTHNRPEFLRLALNSALEQTYPNIEIIIFDTSTDNQTQILMKDYVRHASNIKYFKKDPDTAVISKFAMCLQLASGEFINYLMDDDLFHKNKIEKMIEHYLKNEKITLVTSYRKLIDSNNDILPDESFNVRLFQETTILDGKSLGNKMLTNVTNYVGEPTTVLFRKKDILNDYGVYKKKNYYPNSDVALWLQLLSKGNAVYIEEPLSYLRIHPGQLQLTIDHARYISEWLDLIIDSQMDGFLATKDVLEIALIKYRDELLPNYSIKKYDMKESYIEDLGRVNSLLNTIYEKVLN